jgi:hypothetical protein
MLNKPTNFTNCPIQEIPSSEGMITTGGIPYRRRVALYGIVLRVTVIGPKVRRSFRGKVEPSGQCRIFYGMLKKHSKYGRDNS